MSLDMIVQSCLFALMEQFCPDDEEEDESFAYLIETTSFSLPDVRFSYDVDPPPPPPVTLNAFERIVEEDPEGVEEVRRHLDDWFPRLAHVATSSLGASVGPYMGELDVTPMQLTRAFLASVHMTPDSLGARVIESKHTGRWRYACKMLHDYLHEHASPGQRSAGFTSGRERQRTGHESQYDRNALMYAMLLIKLSMGGDQPHGLASTPFDTIAMHDRICGGGSDNQLYKTGSGPAGWRAATYGTESPTYDVSVDANAFAPVVAMGSLETLQSMRATVMDRCFDDFNTEDLVHLFQCELGDSSLEDDFRTRQDRVPFAIQRDVWCDVSTPLSVESAVGNPFYFTEDLYDTSIKQRFANGRGHNDMRVPAAKRGEERMDADFRAKTLMGWVYVTSSGTDLRAGMYRLLDLPVFRSEPCSGMPDVRCASYARINEGAPLLDVASTRSNHVDFKTGREALPLHRCSAAVERITGVSCNHNVYATRAGEGCVTNTLALVSQPTAYGADHWIRERLVTTPSPSPPPPPPSPGSPPPPPNPSPPPAPPTRVSQFEIMRQVRLIEERMCTSVYYMSQATRCERLALDLTGRIYYSKLSPPGSPPAGPYEPPPPPPPPLPTLPEGLFSTLPTTALLSTNRLPQQNAGLASGDGYYTANLMTTRAALSTTARDLRACVDNAPLYCATGADVSRCMSAGRHCGMAAANARDPYVEFTWPHMPDRYLWAIELVLPPNEQLSRLMVGPKQLRLYGERGEPVPCAEGDQEVYDVTTGATLTVVCQPGDWEAADLHALGGVHRARLTLTGEFRQLWLAAIHVVERAYKGAGVGRRPPPPPLPPALPPAPPAPAHPSVSCLFRAQQFVPRAAIVATFEEPCGLDPQQCCDRLTAAHDLYEIDDAGCCALVTLVVRGGPPIDALLDPIGIRDGYYSSLAGTGYPF